MARRVGAVKTFIALWQCHEKLYYSIFYEALKRLEIDDDRRKNEDAISEALCPVLYDVCFEHSQDVIIPDWEKPIQPVLKEELKGGKVRKRPDFSCNLINSSPDCTRETYLIPFHVECKRLGDTAGSWNLNKNYVTNGIKRFDCKSHEYSKRAPSGMMVGYIVSMEPTLILEKVNNYLPDKLQKLGFAFKKKVVTCEQKLMRKEVKPEEFKLIHLWTELRKCR